MPSGIANIISLGPKHPKKQLYGKLRERMGEVFTDTVNRLDVYRLFQQGHLLES